MHEPRVRMELFGIPRVVAGVDALEAHGASLRAVLHDAVDACPELGEQVLAPDRAWLNSGYTFVVDGRFVNDPDYPIGAGSSLLLVSRASGG